MKKYIFMAVAGMLALSSCSNDDNEIQNVQNAPRTMTFTAGYSDGEQTRATLNADKTVSFDAGDEISIFSANNNNVKFTTTAGGATASFTGTATEGDPTYFALYPYQEGLTLDGTTIKNVNIPLVQKVTTHAWDPKAAIAYATTNGTSLTFHNACALLKVTNDSEDDIEILIADDASVGQLSGTFDLDTSTGALTVQTDQGSTAVMVQHVPNNTTIYIAIAPGTVEKLYANWYNTSTINYGEKKKSTPVTFEAGKIYNLGKTSDWGEAVPTYKMAAAATDADKGKLICSDGHIHAYGADAACTADRVAKIIYAGNSTDDATYKHGLALALNDEGYMKWYEAITACSNNNYPLPVTGASWMLPSKGQWETMIIAAGGYFALRDGFSSVGGTNMLGSVGYWTSTELEGDASYGVCVVWNGSFGNSLKNNNCQVRACLAF